MIPKLSSSTYQRMFFTAIVIAFFGMLCTANKAMAFQGQSTDDSIKHVQSRLDTMRKHLPIEKVYLHTDKPAYNITDTLWFKAYVTDASGRPSKQSGLLYVELNDDSTEAVRRISIPVKNGVGNGHIPLIGKIFHQGGYTLRAYTNWQQNFGDSYYFNQRFYLGVPTYNAWLVNSTAAIVKVDGDNRLDVELKLSRTNRKPIALKDVQVRIYEGRYYLFTENMRTGLDGSLKLSKVIKDRMDGSKMRVQIKSLDKADNEKIVQVPLSIKREQNIDLQFLPEGGRLVAGIKCLVGVKALGEDGLGVDVKGDIFDRSGNKVAAFSTLYKGMGSFSFTPVAGATYTAKLQETNDLVYPLPIVRQAGTVLHVENPEEKDKDIKIQLAGITKMTIDSGCYLLAETQGKPVYVKAVDGTITELAVNKSIFPSGMVRFVLMQRGRVLNERVTFLDHQDRLNIVAIPDRPAYVKRDSVSLNIEIKDLNGMPVKGNFSLSVTDNSQIKPDVRGDLNIATNLLFKAGIRGDIETPGYYMDRTDKQSWQALDNLLLTQGWVGYDMHALFATTPVKPKFDAEKDLRITGTVVNVINKPVANAPVLISSQKPQFVGSTFTDVNGKFTFTNLPAIDSGSFFFQASNAKGKKMSFGETRINKFLPPDIPDTHGYVIYPWYVNVSEEELNNYSKTLQMSGLPDPTIEGTELREVVIRNNIRPPGGVVVTNFNEQEIKESAVMDLYQLLKQKTPGFAVKKLRTGFAGMKIDKFEVGKVTIDGKSIFEYRMHINDLTSVEEFKEELSQFKIATLKSMRVAIDYQNLVAGVSLSTGNGLGWYYSNSVGSVTYRPLPVMQPKQFYSPNYSVMKANANKPDYRSTIYWEPNVYTDVNGKAKVTFYTSDLPSNYSINIQGIGQEGELGSAVIKMPNK